MRWVEGTGALRGRALLVAALLCASLSSRAIGVESRAVSVADAAPLRCDGLDLAPQRLDTALLRLGRSADVSVVFQRSRVHAFLTPAVRGDYSCARALQLLLAGSGLGFEVVDERVIVVRGGLPVVPVADATEVPVPVGAARVEAPHAPLMEELLVRGMPVTGSRIHHPGLDRDGHVDVIDRQQLELKGLQTLGEVLRQLPAVAGNSTSTRVTNGGDGTASVTLRGLPASSTLVLLNGRRLNTDTLRGESADLNTIPLAAVERIEILKDGASAIYGSDAVAGVINVITRRDLHGLHASIYGGVSSRDDLETEHISLMWGHQGARYDVLIGAEYFDQGGVLSRDRAVSSTADDRARGGIDKRSSATVPATVLVDGVAMTLREGRPGTTPEDFRPVTDADRFDFRPFTTAVVPSRRDSLFAEADLTLTGSFDAFAELLHTDTRSSNLLAPAPLFTGFEIIPLTVAADAAFNPFDRPIDDVRRRFVELPGRRASNETSTLRAVAGLRWREDDSGAELYLSRHRTDAVERLDGVLAGPAVRTAIGPAATCAATPGCVPLNLFGPMGSIEAAMLDGIAAATRSEAQSGLTTAAISAFGPLMEGPGGRIEFAVGAEWRKESLQIEPDLRAELQQIVGGGSNFGGTRGDRIIREFHGELLVPLLRGRMGARQLDLHLASRYSNYSDFGSTHNPRLSLRWRPLRDLLLRGSLAAGFRAPTLRELNLTVQQSASFLVDPCAAAVNVGVLPGCTRRSDPSLMQFLTLTGGNPDLRPEQAQSATAGLLWTPTGLLPGTLRLAVDYYRIEQRNVVGTSAQFIVNENARSGMFADRIRRDELGNLVDIAANNINIGRREVSGIDVSVDWQLPPTAWGTFEFELDAAHLRRFLDQLDPDAPTRDQAGTFADAASEGNGALPDWKVNFALVWSRGAWQARYGQRWISAIDEVIPGTDRSREIDDWRVHDLQASYRWLMPGSDIQVALGVENVGDEAPPFAAAAFNDSFDGRTHDLTGRFFYGRVSTRI